MNPSWPELPLEAWRDTYATLHRYVQMVGKIKLALTPLVNHYWNVTLQLTPYGLTTGPMPDGERTFAIDFDFVDHTVHVGTSNGDHRTLALVARPVADFYAELMALLDSLAIRVDIWDHPVEIPTEAIPFHEDRVHAAYDPVQVTRCFRILAQSTVVLEQFRARFIGKSSPVQFFWGTFDLSVSRYSGRRAPPWPDADAITREAYSHEVSSAGWWPGDQRYPEPAFFSYHAPMPDGLAQARVRPDAAFWHPELKNFLLPYAMVREAASPAALVLDFCQSTYEASSRLAGWDHEELERPPTSMETSAPAH